MHLDIAQQVEGPTTQPAFQTLHTLPNDGDYLQARSNRPGRPMTYRTSKGESSVTTGPTPWDPHRHPSRTKTWRSSVRPMWVFNPDMVSCWTSDQGFAAVRQAQSEDPKPR